MSEKASDGGIDPWVWGAEESRPRFLHTMVRVQDFERALRFYVGGFPASGPPDFLC